MAPAPRVAQGAPWWAVIGVLVVSVSITVATNLLYVRAEQRARIAADLQWCELIILEDTTYKAVPPDTATGKTRARIYAELRRTRCL